MRVLIQRASGEFLKADGGWTAEANEGRNFEHNAAAIDFAVASQLNGVRLVLKFGHDPRYDLTLPIIAKSRNHPEP